jgi:DNA invertase Pin-like site-specific DNA recombinase
MNEVYQEQYQRQSGIERVFNGRVKIQGIHLDRLAVVYVRQSTLKQVQEHQESGRLQYALKERAVQLGWSPGQVLVIDQDQGHSGKHIEDRAGFQRLVAEVGLNHVGLVLGIEVSRLARSNLNWHHLLEICGLHQTLIGDVDGIYNPRDYNDRLLLGLKGTMSEAELHILKQRMDAGKWAKARRGELPVQLPTGYVRRPSGEVTKDPDERVQTVVELVFESFERYRTVNGVLRYVLEQKIEFPVREASGPNKGSLRWSRPSRSTVSEMLHNPAYAGAYVYGRRRLDPAKQRPGRRGTGLVTVAPKDWAVCLKNRYPAYITWEQYESNVRQIAANSNRSPGIGAPRQGVSLLAGLLECGRCGLRMITNYNQNGGGLRYVCDRRHTLYREPVCQSVAGAPLDNAVSRLILEALQPLALELSLKVAAELESERALVLKHWQQRLEQARYEVVRAYRQYNAVEPENRLVARQLEGHWETALQAEATLKSDYERIVSEHPVPLTLDERERIRSLAADIPELWNAATTTSVERQAIARQLIEKVVVKVQGKSEQVSLEVHWAGGHSTKLKVIRPIGRLECLTYYPKLIQRVAELWLAGQSVPQIARKLTEEKWRPAKGGKTFTVSMVRRVLARPDVQQLIGRKGLTDGIPKREQEWTTDELAGLLGMPRVSLYVWLNKGVLKARRTRYQKRSVWLIWADEEELKRLKNLRKHPRCGTPRKYIEEASE